MRIIVTLCSLALLATAAQVAAHHGGAVEWQPDVLGPMTGTATDFAFGFPHVTLEMDVEGENGIEHWRIDTRWTPTILRRHGWSRSYSEPFASDRKLFRLNRGKSESWDEQIYCIPAEEMSYQDLVGSGKRIE